MGLNFLSNKARFTHDGEGMEDEPVGTGLVTSS
jgi:hypothetical protein